MSRECHCRRENNIQQDAPIRTPNPHPSIRETNLQDSCEEDRTTCNLAELAPTILPEYSIQPGPPIRRLLYGRLQLQPLHIFPVPIHRTVWYNWERIYSMVHSSSDNSSTSYRKTLASLYGNETLKRDQLQCLHADHNKNVIDDFTSKDLLIYAEAKLRLLALDKSEGDSSSSAFKAQCKDKKTTVAPTGDTTTSCT